MKRIYLSKDDKIVFRTLNSEPNRTAINEILLEKSKLKQSSLNTAVKTLADHGLVEPWWSTNYSATTKISDKGIAYIHGNRKLYNPVDMKKVKIAGICISTIIALAGLYLAYIGLEK